MKIKRKIYWNLCLVALLAMAVSALITALLLCQDLQTQMRQSVMTEVRYLESAMDVSGEEYLAHLKSRGDGNSVNRITWVSPDGAVLYDSFADSESLENHKDRPEIAAALKNGRGESVRTSRTLAEQTYYYAARLDDGSVIRVASTTKSALATVVHTIPVMIAMGILITFGSYMKKDVSIEASTGNVEIFDTAIAIMAGLMIIPAVFAFTGGDPDTLQAGPALMFITIPKVFASMGFGTIAGILFFLLVLFAAVTSSIALTESAVSTFEDELGWSRKKATVMIGGIMLVLGSLSCLGYGPLANVTIIGMQFLDFFDFLTNSVMMPIAAIATCLLVSRVIGMKRIEEEVLHGEGKFHRKRVFQIMVQYLCPVFAVIILISSVANAFGWISM